jgi:hypothetical protein
MAQAEWDAWPDGMEMIRQVREALGLFAGAMPITPKQAWEEALERARGLSQGRCWVCMDKDARAAMSTDGESRSGSREGR